MAMPSGPLSPQTVLARAPELSIRLHSTGESVVGSAERRYRAGPHALAVLDAFARPVTLAAALDALQSRTAAAQDWIDLMETVLGLYHAGLLEEPGESALADVKQPYGYENPSLHIKMLDDRARTESFLAGLREVVRPGDVVVDIGTGTGILAAAAAQAGARHVYAIEAGGAGRFARAMFDANGLGDRVTLLEGWSTQVELPERADVLVSEMIGNEPLDERVLEVTLDARKRFLKDGARLVPHRVRVLCAPMSIPAEDRNRWRFTPETAARWSDWYGVNFTPLAERARDWSYFAYPSAELVRGWSRLGAPALLTQVDLGQFTDIEVHETADLLMTDAGSLDGLLVYFELDLGPTATLGVGPDDVDAGSHWRYPVWLVAPALTVAPGDRFTVSYQYRSRDGSQTIDLQRR